MSELALQKGLVLEYLCDGANGLGYQKGTHLMVSPRLFISSDLQIFLKESSPESWKKVRRHYTSDEEMTEAIEQKLYEDLLSSQNVATFLKQRLHSSFTFQGEPFFLFFASGGSIGGKERDFDRNIFTVVPELQYTFKHEGVKILDFRPDLSFFVNGVYFGYCELKSNIDGQSAGEEGRRKIAHDYVQAVQEYARLAYHNDVTEQLRRRMLHIFEKAIHITTCDLAQLYVVRNLATLTKGLKDQFVNNQIYPADAITQVMEEIKEYPKLTTEEYDPVKLFKEFFSCFYGRHEVEKEFRYYNFIKYNYQGKGGKKVRTSRTGTLISPRPKQKFGVDKVIARLWEFLEHEGEPNYYVDKLRRQLQTQRLSDERIEEILQERSKILNNKYVYSLLLQYAAGFGKSNIIGWLASMMSDMRREGALVFDKILIVVDRLQLRDQLNEMMHNMNLSKVNFKEVTNKKKLIDAMSDENVRVAIVNIQKFNDFEKVISEKGLGTKKMRVAFIIDEIHRTNSGKLHDDMRSSFESLQDALEESIISSEGQVSSHKNVIIGLTATPSDTVLARFGEFYKCDSTRPIWIPFDSYTMREAIDDGYILNPAAHLFSWPVAMTFMVPAGMSDEEEKYTLRKKQIYNNNDRIRKVSKMIVDRLYTTAYPSIRGYGKAMLATSSIEAAQKYVVEIRKAIEERGIIPRFNEAKVYIVYSDSQGKIPASDFNDGKSEEDVIAEFKQGKNGLMIVVDKLQTGFDEPLLHTLFLDKEITGINAIQTISRVNRTAKDKVDCHIIDISHQNVNKEYIRDALLQFSDLTFTELEPLQILGQLAKTRDELMNEELYCCYFKRFEEIHTLPVSDRKSALNDILLKVQEWITREIEEAKLRKQKVQEEDENSQNSDWADHAKQLKKKVSDYLNTIFSCSGIIEVDKQYKEPHFLEFWEHYRRIYNKITRNPMARKEIGVQLDDAGFLPSKSLEVMVTVYPEDEEKPIETDLPEGPKKPSNTRTPKVDPVAEYVKKLNLDEDYNRELILAGQQLEKDFLTFVENDSRFQNTINTEGASISSETKRLEFSRLIRRFKREHKDNYPHELQGYLEHYKERLYDCAMGWKPVSHQEEESKAITKSLERHYDNASETLREVAENGTIEEYGE